MPLMHSIMTSVGGGVPSTPLLGKGREVGVEVPYVPGTPLPYSAEATEGIQPAPKITEEEEQLGEEYGTR